MEANASVPIVQIQVDPDLQPRVEGLDPKHVCELEEVTSDLPPITVVARGASYLVVDGHHTLAAYQNGGRDSIPVRVVEQPADGDLYSLAFEQNLRHGKPLTLTDRRVFAEHQLRQRPHVSNLEIARAAGLSPTTVASVRDRLEAAAEIDQVEQRETRAGTTYTVPATTRRAGDLPLEGLGQTIGRFVTSGERRQQRQIASYFQRLAVALEAQHDLKGFDSFEVTAESIELVLGAQGAKALAQKLGPSAFNTLSVAKCLGYDPAAEDGDDE